MQPARKYLAGVGVTLAAARSSPEQPLTPTAVPFQPWNPRAAVRSDFCPSASVRFTTSREGPRAGPEVLAWRNNETTPFVTEVLPPLLINVRPTVLVARRRRRRGATSCCTVRHGSTFAFAPRIVIFRGTSPSHRVLPLASSPFPSHSDASRAHGIFSPTRGLLR